MSDLEDLLASFEAKREDCSPEPGALSRFRATFLQNTSSRQIDGREVASALPSTTSLQSTADCSNHISVLPSATHGRTPANLPLPVHLGPSSPQTLEENEPGAETAQPDGDDHSTLQQKEKPVKAPGGVIPAVGKREGGGSRRWWPTAATFLEHQQPQPSSAALSGPTPSTLWQEINKGSLSAPPGLGPAELQQSKAAGDGRVEGVSIRSSKPRASSRDRGQGLAMEKLARRAAFSMILLDGDSQKELLARVPPRFSTVMGQQAFIQNKLDAAYLESLPVGARAKLVATEVSTSASAQTVRVRLMEPYMKLSKKPDITISMQASHVVPIGARPTKDLKFTSLEHPIELKGTVCLKMHNGDTLFAMELPPTPQKSKPVNSTSAVAPPLNVASQEGPSLAAIPSSAHSELPGAEGCGQGGEPGSAVVLNGGQAAEALADQLVDQGLEELKLEDPPADRESAFWDDLLARKQEGAVIQPAAAVPSVEAAQPLSDRRRPAKGILKLPQASGGVAEDKPLPKYRPGKQAVSKLWTPGSPLTKPAKEVPAANQPVKLLQRGGGRTPPAAENAPDPMPQLPLQPRQLVAQAPRQPASPGDDLDWLEQYLDGCAISDSPQPSGEPLEMEQTPKRDGSGVFDVLESPQTDEHKKGPSQYKENITKGLEMADDELQKEKTAKKGSSKGVERAGRKVVSFIEQHPKGPSAAVNQAAEILAGQLVDQAEAAEPAQPVAAAESSSISDEDDDDVNGDPWWAGGKLPLILPQPSTPPPGDSHAGTEDEGPEEASDATQPSILPRVEFRGRPGVGYLSDSSDGEGDNYDDLVESMMMAWTGAGGSATPAPMQPAGESSTAAPHRRQVFSVPGAALLSGPERKWAKFEASQQKRERRPRAQGQRPQPQQGELAAPPGVSEPHSLPSGEHREATAQELAQGVRDITAEFPSIHQHVAEMTLRNYGGDLEEAMGFLKMTALTATPAQLAQLGLTRRKETAAGRKDALAGWRKQSGNGTASASNSARSTLGSGSGDEGLAAAAREAREARSRFATAAAPGTIQAESLLEAEDPSEAIAMAISGAEMTLAERQRLRAAEEEARVKWQRHHRAKQIYNEAAAQMERKGSKESASWLRQLAYEQSQLANEFRKQCNDTAYQFSNQHVTNKIKLDLHGMSVDEAIAKLDKHVSSLTGLSSSTFVLQVVTGKGKHSAGGVARLGPAVREHVDVRGLTWSEEPGNPGQINVVIAGDESNS